MSHEVRLYATCIKDLVYGTLALIIYYFLQWKTWSFQAVHALSWLVLFFITAGDAADRYMSTLAILIVYITLLTDMFLGFSLSCHITTCCIGHNYAPFSIKYSVCDDSQALGTHTYVYVAIFCGALSIFSAISRVLTIAKVRKNALLEVASALAYAGVRVYLLLWTDIHWPLLFWVQSIVVAAVNGVGVALSYRSKVLGFLCLALVLGADLLSTVGIFGVVGSVGKQNTNVMVPGYNLFPDGSPASQTIVQQIQGAHQTLSMAVQSNAAVVANNAQSMATTITVTGCCMVTPQIPTTFQAMQKAVVAIAAATQGDAIVLSVQTALAAAGTQTDYAFAQLPVPDAQNLMARYNSTMEGYNGSYGFKPKLGSDLLSAAQNYNVAMQSTKYNAIGFWFEKCSAALESYVPTLSPAAAQLLFNQANATCLPYTSTAVEASNTYSSLASSLVQQASTNEQSLASGYQSYMGYTQPIYSKSLWSYLKAHIKTWLRWIRHEIGNGQKNFSYQPVKISNDVMDGNLPEIVFVAAVVVLIIGIVLILIETYAIYEREDGVKDPYTVPFFGVSHIKVGDGGGGDDDSGATVVESDMAKKGAKLWRWSKRAERDDGGV